jgi:N,N'-diacetyllegionaminate synthase
MSDRCVIVAETGLNHDGNPDRAHAMIDAAADAGADAVKFQAYRTDDFIGDRTLTYNGEPQYDMFTRCELPDEMWPELRDHCADRGVVFFATPTSEERLEFLLDLGVPWLKNGSDYLVHLPLIRAMARTGLPTFLSVGMATEDEINDAVEAFDEAGGGKLTLMHCTSSYPTAATDVNLLRIPALAEAYGTPVGFSDHTTGVLAALAARTLGATIIEKHFTLDQKFPGPDHAFSASPLDLYRLVGMVSAAEEMLGDPKLEPATVEEQSRRDFRLSCAAARDLPAGHTIRRGDIVFQRPGTGIPPAHADALIGARLTAPIPKGALLR